MQFVAMRGLSGCGKSTVARALGARLGWPVIDKDDIKDLLDGETPAAGRLAYDVLLRIVRRQLLLGLNVICDSPLTFPGLYATARQISAECGAMLCVVECICSDEVAWRARIEARQLLDLPAHHQTEWSRFLDYRAALPDETRFVVTDPELVVDTVRPLGEVVDEVVGWLASLTVGHPW